VISFLAVLLPWLDGEYEISQIADTWLRLGLLFYCACTITLLIVPWIVRKIGSMHRSFFWALVLIAAILVLIMLPFTLGPSRNAPELSANSILIMAVVAVALAIGAACTNWRRK